MPRSKRRTVPGAVYHLISRFVDRDWYIESELERAAYVRLLGHALDGASWRCLGFAVMSNHIHLATVAGEEPLATWIRRVHSPFADWLNRSRGRIGPIFTRGPKDIVVPDSRVGQLLAYIHNNPVRAKVVEEPGDSTWTSHRYYTRVERAPLWLCIEEGIQRAQLVRSTSFDAFVRATTGHPVLGQADSDEELMQRVEEYEKRQAALLAQRSPSASYNPGSLVAAAAAELGITVAQLTSKRRSSVERLARAVIISCGRSLGMTSTELGSGLGVTPQAVRRARAIQSFERDMSELSERVLRRLRESKQG